MLVLVRPEDLHTHTKSMHLNTCFLFLIHFRKTCPLTQIILFWIVFWCRKSVTFVGACYGAFHKCTDHDKFSQTLNCWIAWHWSRKLTQKHHFWDLLALSKLNSWCEMSIHGVIWQSTSQKLQLIFHSSVNPPIWLLPAKSGKRRQIKLCPSTVINNAKVQAPHKISRILMSRHALSLSAHLTLEPRPFS